MKEKNSGSAVRCPQLFFSERKNKLTLYVFCPKTFSAQIMCDKKIFWPGENSRLLTDNLMVASLVVEISLLFRARKQGHVKF